MYRPEELFAGAAWYCARYRPEHPEDLIALLVRRFGLDGRRHFVDLGCGTGQLALPLAPHAARVTAVDPEPGMLQEGRRLARRRGITNVDFLLGDSTRLAELDLGGAHLATMGASFHWMDREATLLALDGLVAPGGGVAVISNGGHATGQREPPWSEIALTVRTRHLGPHRRTGSGTYHHPAEGHAEVLARSPFRRVETRTFRRAVHRDVESVIGLQLSHSSTTPARLGAALPDFVHDLRAALLQAEPGGVFTHEILTEAHLAVRPDDEP